MTVTTQQSFLNSYIEAFGSIEGMFSPDAALMFMAYNALAARDGVRGDVMEIGVHHGLSTIAIAALRDEGRSLLAVDLFEEMQDLNVSASGSGNRERFIANMARFFGDTSFIEVYAGLSSKLDPSKLGKRFSFCHIDGGHSDEETYGDLLLASRITLPGGLVALDDYFNSCFPGVCEGAIRFKLDHPGELVPLAVGFNKVLFRKAGSSVDLNREFASAYAHVPHAVCEFWGCEAFLFDTGFQGLFDLNASTPANLQARPDFTLGALIEPLSQKLAAHRDQTVMLPVRVRNLSSIQLQGTSSRVGLSYHLLGTDGSLQQYDNMRRYFDHAVLPGEQTLVELPVLAPRSPGQYVLELDVVWEGVTWFQQKGSKTAHVELKVQ